MKVVEVSECGTCAKAEAASCNKSNLPLRCKEYGVAKYWNKETGHLA